jgi:hypothetical protein
MISNNISHHFAFAFAMATTFSSMTPLRPAFAQAPNTTASYLQKLKEQATTENKKWNQLLKNENEKGANANLCVTNALSWRIQANEFFLTQFGAYEKLDAQYEATSGKLIARANQKWQDLHDSPVSLIPVKGQNGDKTLTLTDVTNYLIEYNKKWSNYTAAQKADLKIIQNDPRQNRFGIAHIQLSEAIQLMTQTVNASLKEEQSFFELIYSENDSGAQLEFVIRDGRESNAKVAYRFNALSGNSSLAFSEKDKWREILSQNPTINEVPLDGALRYQYFQSQARLQSCANALPESMPSGVLNAPWVPFESIEAEVEREIALGARSKFSSSTQSSSAQTSMKASHFKTLTKFKDWKQFAFFSGSFNNTSVERAALINGLVYARGSGYAAYWDDRLNYWYFTNSYSFPSTTTSTFPAGVLSHSTYQNIATFGVNYDGDLVRLSNDKGSWEVIAGISLFGSDVVSVSTLAPNHLLVITRNGDAFEFANRVWTKIAVQLRPMDFYFGHRGKVCGYSNQSFYCLE